MLSLNGGAALESPIMGAIADLDPNNAYTIMSYMSIKVGAGCVAAAVLCCAVCWAAMQQGAA